MLVQRGVESSVFYTETSRTPYAWNISLGFHLVTCKHDGWYYFLLCHNIKWTLVETRVKEVFCAECLWHLSQKCFEQIWYIFNSLSAQLWSCMGWTTSVTLSDQKSICRWFVTVLYVGLTSKCACLFLDVAAHFAYSSKLMQHVCSRIYISSFCNEGTAYIQCLTVVGVCILQNVRCWFFLSSLEFRGTGFSWLASFSPVRNPG